MRLIASFLILFATPILALDQDEIRKIVGEPHSRENLVPELNIYPEARRYKITSKAGKPGEPPKTIPEMFATEHTVRGKYLVTILPFPGDNLAIFMVVEYLAEAGTFKKWVLLPDGKVVSSTGIGDPDTRTIAWISDPNGSPDPVLSIETHNDDRSTWKETTLRDGEVIWIVEGTAKVAE